MDRSLNVGEPQILLFFGNDVNGVLWHHRLLLHKVGGGRWVVLTPDMDLEIADLATQRHRVLGRHAPIPQDVADISYIFDDLPRAELERQKRLARTMGSILDDSQVAVVEEVGWLVADPSSKRFGETLPHDLVQDVMVQGQHGLVEWDGEVEYVRELQHGEVEAFKEARKDSLTDSRILGLHKDAQGKRFLSLNDALALMSEEKMDDWPFSGPRAVKEYLVAIRDGPGDLPTYHLSWVRGSGVSASSAIAHEHRALIETLRLAMSKDQLDITNLASFENVCRRLITLEMAVARNPSSPDFTGLEVVAEAPITSQGQAYVSSISTWVTDRLKEKAQIQKQTRLFREEFNKKPGRGGGGAGEADTDPSKRWKRKKKQCQNNDGGGAVGSTAAA